MFVYKKITSFNHFVQAVLKVFVLILLDLINLWTIYPQILFIIDVISDKAAIGVIKPLNLHTIYVQCT